MIMEIYWGENDDETLKEKFESLNEESGTLNRIVNVLIGVLIKNSLVVTKRIIASYKGEKLHCEIIH